MTEFQFHIKIRLLLFLWHRLFLPTLQSLVQDLKRFNLHPTDVRLLYKNIGLSTEIYLKNIIDELSFFFFFFFFKLLGENRAMINRLCGKTPRKRIYCQFTHTVKSVCKSLSTQHLPPQSYVLFFCFDFTV